MFSRGRERVHWEQMGSDSEHRYIKFVKHVDIKCYGSLNYVNGLHARGLQFNPPVITGICDP